MMFTRRIDPTKNVLDKVEDAVKRVDDVANLRAQHAREMADLREQHAERLRIAEAARLDAIRANDEAARDRANQVQVEQATALVAQVASVAEAARAGAETAKAAARAELTATIAPIQQDVEALKQARYLNAGGTAKAVEVRQAGTARSGSVGMWIGIAVTMTGIGLSFLVGLAGLLLAVYVAVGR